MTTKAESNNGQLPIHAAIVKIMQELGAVGKDRKNQAQGYQFRGIDDVYNAINPLLGKYGVFSVPEVLETHREEKATKSGGSMTATHLRIRYTFYAGDGTFIQATVEGEGMDSGDKSTNKAMAVAHKYAILQVFAIPTEDAKDPEHENPQPVATKPPAKPQPTPAPKPAPEKKAEPASKDKLKGEDEIWPIGKQKGKRFKDVDRATLQTGITWMKNTDKDKFTSLIQKAEAYLKDTGLPGEWDDPENQEFGVKNTAALMDLVEHSTIAATLDTVSGRAKKHLDQAEITELQYNLIIGAIAGQREILG